MTKVLQVLVVLIAIAMIATAFSPIFGVHLGFFNMLRIVGVGVVAILVLLLVAVVVGRRG